jgi:hypothetical protein
LHIQSGLKQCDAWCSYLLERLLALGALAAVVLHAQVRHVLLRNVLLHPVLLRNVLLHPILSLVLVDHLWVHRPESNESGEKENEKMRDGERPLKTDDSGREQKSEMKCASVTGCGSVLGDAAAAEIERLAGWLVVAGSGREQKLEMKCASVWYSSWRDDVFRNW